MPAIDKQSRLRTMAGKPLALIVGWVLSCALVTGVTLTAVGRVGHEISGNQPQVITEQQVLRNLTATPTAVSLPATSTPAVTSSPSPSTPSPKPVVGQTSKSASPSTTPSGHPKPTLPPTEKPSSSSPPPVVRPTAPPATSHPATSSAVSPPATTAPASSPVESPSPSPSPSPDPSASVPTGKYFENVNGGEIIIACAGDTVSQASAVLTQGSKYTFVLKSTSPKVDAIFTAPDGTSTEYVFTCAAGQVVGGQVTPEHTS